jgi:hypothetical protein
MESPGPGHGHRGFRVQRNHESGGIVIGVILPRSAALLQRIQATSCNRDIFTIPKSGQCNFQIRLRVEPGPSPRHQPGRAHRRRGHNTPVGIPSEPGHISGPLRNTPKSG